jgi:small conductance mechanosensitive channel
MLENLRNTIVEGVLRWEAIRIGVSAIVCFVSYFIVRFFVKRGTRLLASRIPSSGLRVLNFFLIYGIYALVVGATLNLFGFNISALLGAAGVFGVAISFASQTTFTNVISGVFLMIEQSLKMGDIIAFNGVQGRISNVGLLSLTLKTADNKLIRIPNELLIKSSITNITALKDRVIVFNASSENEVGTQKILKEAWERMELAVKEKAVSVSYTASSSSLVGFSVNIWVKTQDVAAAKSEYIQQCVALSKEQKVNIYISSQG